MIKYLNLTGVAPVRLILSSVQSTDDIAKKISFFHYAFLICLALCILCLVITAILFFALKIKDVLEYLTGRKARKQIKELEEVNESSGRLTSKKRTNMQYVAQEMKEDMGVRDVASPGARKVEHAVTYETVDTVSRTEEIVSKGDEATTLLSQAQDTMILQKEEEQSTVLLKEEEEQGTMVLPKTTTLAGAVSQNITSPMTSAKAGKFQIEREIILVHAEEVI